MKTLQNILLTFILLMPLLGNSQPLGLQQVKTFEIQEDDVTFSYSSSDGAIQLKCAHVFDKPDANDWDVWCGKGTNMLRMFRIHFLARKYKSQTTDRSAYEVLYWVNDRDQHFSKAYSSASSWVHFKNDSHLDLMSFSVGVENDYAYLTIEYKPKP